MQLLHAGRYGYTPLNVSASATKSPITPFKAGALSARGVERTIEDYVDAARLARRAGYDGVEIMGSEGYLINQFLAPHTNRRTDRWGGSAENRMRFPVEIVRRTREALGADFLVMFRMCSSAASRRTPPWPGSASPAGTGRRSPAAPRTP